MPHKKKVRKATRVIQQFKKAVPKKRKKLKKLKKKKVVKKRP